jgi:hypothetical protein
LKRYGKHEEPAMMLETVDIPQADVLWDVARVPEALTKGRHTTDAIAEYIGMKVARQGSYYTQAARILGFLTQGDGDELKLTAFGKAFARSNRLEQGRHLRRLMFYREPMRSVLIDLQARDGVDRRAIAAVLQSLAPLADSTAQRRAATVAAWLGAVGLAEWRDGRLCYCGPALPIPPSEQQVQPLRPAAGWP